MQWIVYRFMHDLITYRLPEVDPPSDIRSRFVEVTCPVHEQTGPRHHCVRPKELTPGDRWLELTPGKRWLELTPGDRWLDWLLYGL